ncbi:hypothetical protein M1523_01840 [Patescibacteria group bacterium]|nr:hypothetical protein [Patescibacteria group bacterium]
MVKKSFVVTVIFGVNALIQLISQVVVTRIFGAKLDLDVFLAAVALPTLAVSTIYSTLNDAFLPLYGEKKVTQPDRARSYFISHLLFFTAISLVVALIANLLAQPISQALYQARSEEFVRAVALQMGYLFYSLPLATIATLLGAHFYAGKKFNRFPFAQLVGNLTNIAMIVVLQPVIGPWSLVIAFVANLFFQILVLLPPKKIATALNSLTLKPVNSPTFQLVNPITLVVAWLPLIVAYSTFRGETVFIRSLAAGLPAGYLVYLNLIVKMFTLATGVMTIGIQILLLPHLVEYFARPEQHAKALHLVKKAKLVALAVSFAVTIAVLLIAPLLINFLFIGGKFSRQDALTTNTLLPLFVIPAIGWGSYAVFFQPLLALKKTVPLALVCVAATALGWITAGLIRPAFGPLSAISFGLIVWLGFGIMGAEALWQIYKKKMEFLPF